MTDGLAKVEITTNHHRRPVLGWHELTEQERADFDWLEMPEYASFARYRRSTYNLGDLDSVRQEFRGWHGYVPESRWSGTLVRFNDDDDGTVTFGSYYIYG